MSPKPTTINGGFVSLSRSIAHTPSLLRSTIHPKYSLKI
nr:MAG TPA: hypothetical protein [Inoviridae sp.]